MVHVVGNIEQVLASRTKKGLPLGDMQCLERLRLDTPAWYGWNTNYVVPCNQLAPYLNSFEEQLINELFDADDRTKRDYEVGWLSLLAARAAPTCGLSSATLYRRLHGIRSGSNRVVSATIAEALLMVGDLDLDRDTTIPTLPSSRYDAFDLLCIRATALDPKTKARDLLRFVSPVLQLSAAIIESPELTSQLQDDAPFNCLRPWGDQ